MLSFYVCLILGIFRSHHRLCISLYFRFVHNDQVYISCSNQCDDDFQASESLGKETIGVDRTQEISQKKTTNASTEKKNSTTEATRRKKMSEEERIRLKEEKKLRKLVSSS